MTIKELAKFTGKNESTIQRWIKKAACKMSSVACKMQAAGHGKITDYNIEEIECILTCSSLGEDAVAVLMQNARHGAQDKACKESIFSEKDFAMISQIVSLTVAETMIQLDSRLTRSENKIEEKKVLPAPQIKPRDHVCKLVREYSNKNSVDYVETWRELYNQYGYRTNSNPSICAKNRGMKIIDYIDAEGQIEVLESIAMEIFK